MTRARYALGFPGPPYPIGREFVPPGRHRGGAVWRPLPLVAGWRLGGGVRLPVASVGVAALLLGATAVVAGAWANARSGSATHVLTVAIGQRNAAPAADALQGRTGSRSEERTSRDGSGPAAAKATPRTTQSPAVVPALAGAGPGRAPASRSGAKLGARSAAAGLSAARCPISSSIQSHLTANARAVYRAVCAAFHGTVSSFGGYRAGSSGDHGTGRAVDIMVSGDPGLAIAHYVQAHAEALHVTYVIYQQKIWLAGKPTSQWTPMEDRGSRTANHYDHVHVSVY
jgi:hypothetical protein